MSIRITIPTLSVLLVAVSILVLVQHHDDHDRSLRLRSPHDDGISDTSPNSDVWIVELKPGAAVGVSSLASQITRNGKGHVGFVFQHALQGFVYHGSDIDAIATNALVKSVTRDTISRITASRVRQSTPTGIRRIFAHTKKYMKQANQNCRCDAVVAVLDTGVDFQYPDVEVNTAMSVDCTRGAWGEGNCKQGQGDDDHGHGTHVAGTIAAISNGQGVVGVCPGAEIWSIKVLSGGGWGYNSWILAGIEYVMSHASRIDVVNMSLSGYGCDKMYCAVIGRAKRSGIAFAVAAGNDNQPADLYQPACCQAVMSKSIYLTCGGCFVPLTKVIMYQRQLSRLCLIRTEKQAGMAVIRAAATETT